MSTMYRRTAVCQKGTFKGCFFHEKTSLSSLLVLIVHILSFQNLDASVWATPGIIVKIGVISRKVEIIQKIVVNQCFASPRPKNGPILMFEVSKCVYGQAGSRKENQLEIEWKLHVCQPIQCNFIRSKCTIQGSVYYKVLCTSVKLIKYWIVISFQNRGNVQIIILFEI